MSLHEEHTHEGNQISTNWQDNTTVKTLADIFITRACTNFCVDSKHRALNPPLSVSWATPLIHSLNFRLFLPPGSFLLNPLPSQGQGHMTSHPYHGFLMGSIAGSQSGPKLTLGACNCHRKSHKGTFTLINSIFYCDDFQDPLSRLNSKPPLKPVFSLLSEQGFHNPCSEPTDPSFQRDMCEMLD